MNIGFEEVVKMSVFEQFPRLKQLMILESHMVKHAKWCFMVFSGEQQLMHDMTSLFPKATGELHDGHRADV